MVNNKVFIDLASEDDSLILPAREVAYSPYRCFQWSDSPKEKELLRLWGAQALAAPGPLAFYGQAQILRRFIACNSDLLPRLAWLVVDDLSGPPPMDLRLPTTTPQLLPQNVGAVLLGETRSVHLQRMRARISRDRLVAAGPENLSDSYWATIPDEGWVDKPDCIYPIKIPEIVLAKGLELALVDCPSRDMALMPNGLAHVHNIIQGTGIEFQTLDLDIICYHRFHQARLMDQPDSLKTPGGQEIPADPWAAEQAGLWNDQGFLDYFQPELEEAATAIIKASPKILALSISDRNAGFARRLAREVRAGLPQINIIVGGYSCYQPEVGLRAFPDCDYMVLGESELTLPPLLERLLSGRDGEGLPGVLKAGAAHSSSINISPVTEDLDSPPMPTYQWATPRLYRNYNNYQLTPIISSRGCRWSRCNFCAERLQWRSRSPLKVVDEMEWLVGHGCNLFMFNESDFNGSPKLVADICREVLKRELVVKMTGQLRIHPHNNQEFFALLKRAGFNVLRFGVDAWCEHTLKLQNKGYRTQDIYQNLQACSDAGIFTEVNAIIGIPGETAQDIEDSISLMKANRLYINRVATLNPLMLFVGSLYWQEPERYGIVLRAPKPELVERFGYAIPSEMWYSREPFLDHEGRLDRLYRMVRSLDACGIELGSMVRQRLQNIEQGRDQVRGVLAKKIDTNTVEAFGHGAQRNDEPCPTANSAAIIEHQGKFYRIEQPGQDKLTTLLPGRLEKRANLQTLARKLGMDKIRYRRQGLPVELWREGWHGYNLVQAGHEFYGVRQGIPVDWETMQADQAVAPDIFHGSTLPEVQRQIESAMAASADKPRITLKVAAKRTQKTFKPLVVGYPRTGFTLLLSVLSNLYPFTPLKDSLQRRAVRALVEVAGGGISQAIEETFKAAGMGERLVFNPAFRIVTGGPKWLHPDDPGKACIRKYIGVVGLGDFTLVISHPREVLDYDDIVHSHSHPARWLDDSGYSDYKKMAALRNPVGTVNSACFSINALTSEYIRRFLPAEKDNDLLRQHLALYKLTDLNFFLGLLRPLKAYLEEFYTCIKDYTVMRWEDLIQDPQGTIKRLAESIGAPIDEQFACEIWDRIGCANLTGSHGHNYRVGQGKVGGWRQWLTNRHLEIMREEGFETLCQALGYGPLSTLDPKQYTPFQAKVDRMLVQKKVYQDYPDQDLFRFAFNKSNLDAKDFKFDFYGWKEHSQLERADFNDKGLMDSVWDAAEKAVAAFNLACGQMLDSDLGDEASVMRSFKSLVNDHPQAFQAMGSKDNALDGLIRSFRACLMPPRLLRSLEDRNIVIREGLFYSIPHVLGPIDLTKVDPIGMAGVKTSTTFNGIIRKSIQN